MKFRDLSSDEIEVRVQSIKQRNGEPVGVILLLYKNARCDMNILDETVGAENWQNNFYEHKGILFCSLGINTNYADKSLPDRWVWKDDAGVESNTEAEKGNASDARKRSGFVWGIGRELYTAPFTWITPDKCNIYNTGRKDKYGLPIFATNDHFSVEAIKTEDKRITALVIRNDTKKERAFVWQMQK